LTGVEDFTHPDDRLLLGIGGNCRLGCSTRDDKSPALGPCGDSGGNANGALTLSTLELNGWCSLQSYFKKSRYNSHFNNFNLSEHHIDYIFCTSSQQTIRGRLLSQNSLD
jgi:hypothetical protein